MFSVTSLMRVAAGATLLAGIVYSQAASAQASDRERAQMLQMQQQLQRVQSDNASLQQERNQLQEKAKDAEKAKKDAASTGKELARVKAEAAESARALAALRAEFDAFREQSVTQTENWKKALEERDNALQVAALEKRRADNAMGLLTGRLKAQTARADLCETKHVQAMQFGTKLVERYEQERLRLCEPVTGFWKVRNENEIQKLRDELYEFRLDVPAQPAPQAPAPEAAKPAS